MGLALRVATVDDAPLLRAWDEREHVLLSDPDSDWEWETELLKYPDWREQLIAEVDGVPIGFMQIIDPRAEESHYWGEVEENLRAIDIWIGEEACLNRGFGTQMMRMAIERCFAPAEVKAILIDPLASNTRVHPFYERLGFRLVGPRNFHGDECLVYRLERSDWSTAARNSPDAST